VLVEFIQLDDVCVIAMVASSTCAAWSSLTVRDLVDRLPYAASAHPAPGRAASRAAAMTMLRHAADKFDAMLLRPIAPLIRDRPLVVIPTGHLQSLPWSILPSCASRPVTVSPSASLWHLAATAEHDGHRTVAVAADRPGQRPAEAHAVRRPSDQRAVRRRGHPRRWPRPSTR
jgi:hypothetical protein